MGLKEILKVSDDGSTLGVWHTQAISVLESFLVNVKASIQQQQLPLLPIAISYSNDTQSKSIQKTAELLSYIFTQMGMPTTLCPLEDAAKLNTQLDGAGYAVVLCTSEYAAKVGKGSVVWNVLDNFGKKKKNALHPLLCEGEFRDVALQIVDGHYLIRSFHAILNQDPLMALPALVDIVFHLSGSQGLGLLPDVLNLKETVNATAEAAYKERFNTLQSAIQKQSINYRLKTALEESAQKHPLKEHFNIASLPKIKETTGFAPLVDEILSSTAKVGLLFGVTRADTELSGFALTQSLIEKNVRVLSIECSDYPGKAAGNCVQLALQKMKFKPSDIEGMKKKPFVVLLKGYENIGAYDNLWVKNKLSAWANVKMIVTCRADFFRFRGYLNCFLADVSNRVVDEVSVYKIPTFSSLEAQMAALTLLRTPAQLNPVETASLNSKRNAEYVELTRFLKKLNQIWVEKDFIKSSLAQNPQLFISYAWEGDKTALARQQMHLSRIAFDFTTLGFPTWLDIERMSGHIDEQMAGNIATSQGVLVIETPRYIERSGQNTNVKKEWDAIYVKSQQQPEFRVFPIQYSPTTNQGNPPPAITTFLANHPNRSDFTQADNDYLERMTHPEIGIIPKWICDAPEKKDLYQTHYQNFQQDLQLLVAKHLIPNQGQDDVLAFDMDNRLKGYIAPFGLYTQDSPMESRFDLVKHFEEFLNKAERKTAIILGRAGSGKSLFALSTFKYFLAQWVNYQNTNQERPQWLPIFIKLRNYAQHPEQAITRALKQQFQLSDADIQALREGLNHQQHVLFILDGYDELGSNIRPNYTQALKSWPLAKLLITSRPEHFDNNHRPSDVLGGNEAQEVHVSPFIPDEIKRYVANYDKGKNTDTYQILQSLPGMMMLLDNPFLLTLVLQSLPQLLENRKKQEERSIFRVDIYEAFTQTWFLQETKGRDLNPKVCETFSQELAYRLFAAKTITVSDTAEKKELWTFFNHKDHQAAQDASPLRYSGGEYSFIHKSIYEYFVATRLWRAILEPDCANLWKTRMLTEEYPIIDFLAELIRTQRFSEQEKQLFLLIEDSRNPDFPVVVSSNAITTLNAATVGFSGKDLRYVRIPGANLSGAILDGTQLEKTDLTRVNLSGAWLQGANLAQAKMEQAILGERPTLSIKASEISFGNHVQSCCYSPDGRFLAVVIDNEVQLYDAITSELIRIFKGHNMNYVWSAAFSPNGQILATGSSDFTTHLWDVATGGLEKTALKEDTNLVYSVTFSPDGLILATGSYDKSIKLWQVRNGILQKTLEGHTEPVRSVAFSPDGQFLASGSEDKSVKLWSVKNGTLQKTLEEHTNSVFSVAFSPNGQLLATGSEDKTAKLWQLNTGGCLKTLNGHTQKVVCVGFTPDSMLLATASFDKTAKLWQVTTGVCLKTLEGHTQEVTCVAFIPDAALLATASWDSTVKLWQVTKNVFQKTLGGHTSSVTSVFFSPNGELLATGSLDNTAKLWHVRNGNLQKTFEGHVGGINSVAISPDGKLLATGSEDKTTKLWLIKAGSLEKTLEEHTEPVKSIAFSPDGQLLATGSKDWTVNLWQVATGELLKTLQGHTNPVESVVFSPDGRVLVTGSKYATVKLWQATENWVLQRTFEGHIINVVRSVIAFSPDGHWLACGTGTSNTGELQLWSIKSSKLHKKLSGHTNPIEGVAFSPDGQVLATSGDTTIRLWTDFRGPQEPFVSITQVSSQSNAIAFLQNNQGTFLASGHGNHSVRYWMVISKDAQPYLQLLWSTHQNSLLAQNACIQNAEGLSQNNQNLLLQRGAIGKPLMFTDAEKNASSINSNDNLNSQSNHNYQHRNEAQWITREAGESSNTHATSDLYDSLLTYLKTQIERDLKPNHDASKNSHASEASGSSLIKTAQTDASSIQPPSNVKLFSNDAKAAVDDKGSDESKSIASSASSAADARKFLLEQLQQQGYQSFKK